MDMTPQPNLTAEEAPQSVNSQEQIQTTVRALRALLEGEAEEQRETFAYLKQVLEMRTVSPRVGSFHEAGDRPGYKACGHDHQSQCVGNQSRMLSVDGISGAARGTGLGARDCRLRSAARTTPGQLCVGVLVLSHFEFEGFRTVMPAQAGIQGDQAAASGYSAWIPAFAGMTQHSSPPQNHHDRL